MSPQASPCDRTWSASPATGLLPFLAALVLAMPLAPTDIAVTLRDSSTPVDTTAASSVAGPVAPAAAPVDATAAAPAASSSPTSISGASTGATAPVADASPTPSDPGFIGPVATVTTGSTTDAASRPVATASVARQTIWTGVGSRRRPVLARPVTQAALRPVEAQPTGQEGVLNSSAAAGTSAWQADSAAAPVSITRVAGISGPFAATTALQLSRSGGSGDWARALAAVASPTTFFVPGQSYTMSAWVRDMNATGKSVGLLVADGAYQNRPTEMSVYEGHADRSWHLLSRTFTATSKASADTGIYLALPESGAFAFQMTGVSVQRVASTAPAAAIRPPSRTVDFAGAAGQAPDPAVWNHETGGGGWGNGELQTYTDRSSNAQVDGAGNLVITARRETLTGSDGITRRYTSARLSTEGKMVIQPGSYVEASITAPVGNAVWPAFWLIGANVRQVGWPASGELDVLEGAGAQPTKAFNAAHMAKLGDPSTDMQYGWGDGGTVDLGQSLDSASHLYGVYFDGQSVRFFIDRREVRSLSAAEATASGRAWPFGKPQYVVLNIAVDGDSGDPVSTSFPRSMVVGGISVWTGGVPF